MKLYKIGMDWERAVDPTRSNLWRCRFVGSTIDSLISILPSIQLVQASHAKNKTIKYIHFSKSAAFPQNLRFFFWFPTDFLLKKRNMVSALNSLGSSHLQARIPRVESSHHLARFVDIGSHPWDVHVTQDPNGPTDRPPDVFRSNGWEVEVGIREGCEEKFHSLLGKFKHLGWWMLLNLVGNLHGKRDEC